MLTPHERILNFIEDAINNVLRDPRLAGMPLTMDHRRGPYQSNGTEVLEIRLFHKVNPAHPVAVVWVLHDANLSSFARTALEGDLCKERRFKLQDVGLHLLEMLVESEQACALFEPRKDLTLQADHLRPAKIAQ